MKLSYTKRVLSRAAAPALENENTEEVVDQAVIDAQPTEGVVEETVDEVPAEEIPVEETPAETLPEDAIPEVTASVVEDTEAPVDGIDPVEPPQVVPVSETGEITVDQAEAVAAGDVEGAAEAVVETDEQEGIVTTPEEVIEEAETVAEETPVEEGSAEAPVETSDITPEGEVPSSDEVVSDVDGQVEENLEPVATEEPTSDAPEDTPAEDSTEPEGTSEVSNEGFVGGVLGFIVGAVGWTPFVGAGISAAAKAKRLALKKDIEVIAKRIAKIHNGELADAEKNGTKIPDRDHVKEMDWVEIVKSAILGTILGPIYGAYQGSELQNLNRDLKAKIKELEEEIERAGISTESFPTESATEDCACEAEGTNPPANVIDGSGESELPPESTAVDAGKGEETLPPQDTVTAEDKGEEVKPSQEKVTSEGAGEETLPPQDKPVEEGKGANVNTGEVVSTESSEVEETVVTDAPVVETPVEAANEVEGVVATDVPVVEETSAEAPTDGVVQDAVDIPVVNPEADDSVEVIDTADFTTGEEDEESIIGEALDTYPKVIDVVEGSLQNGGLSVEAMALLNIFTARDGIPVKSDVSLENYNYTAKSQSKLAVESLKEDMQGWMEKALEMIKRGLAKIKEFLHERFNQVGILQRRAKALRDVDMGLAGGKELTGSYFADIQVEGKIPNNWVSELGDFTNQYRKIKKFRHSAAGASEKIVDLVKSDILNVLVKDGEQQVNVQEIYNRAEEIFKGIATEGDFEAQNNRGFPSYKSPELIGDIQLELLYGAQGGEGKWERPTFNVNKLEFEPASTGPSLSGQQIRSVAMDVQAILGEVEEKFFDDAYVSKISGAFSEIIRITKLNANSNNSHRNELQAVRAMLISANLFAIDVVSRTTNLAVRVAKSAIEYAEASAKAANDAA